MILKDLMEEKKLNLNQPFLSVRRFSSTMASETDHKSKSENSLARLSPTPAYKSELKSDSMRNAGTVPFLWEKAPGRPKDESILHTQVVDQPPITNPNFPPGRVSQIKQQSLAEMRTGSTLSNSQSVASLDKRATKYSKGETKKRECSDSDDGDEAYEDCLDTLSRTESFFMSCRVSGLSGWSEQEDQPSGSFSSDHQQSRDFMIDRFLPAAKAMISEAPQYASKKTLVGQEQRKQKNKELNTESSHPLNQHRPKPLPYFTQNIDSEESDDYNEYENYTTTTCGLFHRFCLLNPTPGLRMVDKVQRNATHGMQAKSAASHIESAKEQARTPYRKKSVDSHSGFTEDTDILDILVKSKLGTCPHQRGCRKLLSCESSQHDSNYESHVVEKTLHVDSVHKIKSQTNDLGEYETLRRDSGIYSNPSIDSSAKVIESKKTNSESQVYGREKNSNILTQNSELDLKRQLAAKWVDQESTLASSKVRYNGKTDIESQCCIKLGHQEISGTSCFGLPLTLPSLKAPSESWLKRTLPTICKRDTTSQSNLTANIYARSKIPKTTLHPKWETFVKYSNSYHGHLQLPEDLQQTPIPEA